jgi:rhodanese-related sulfurtransferase
MAVGIKEMMEAANKAVPRVTHEEADALVAEGSALIVDVREASEVQARGKVAGAVHVSLGMLEFRADPLSPYYDPRFDRSKPVIVYCASGGRAALSGKVLKEMGYEKVFNLGGFKDWAAVGRAVEPGG